MEPAINVPVIIIEFVLAFGFLIFIHELGHHLAARFFNIEVEEFGIGFPPRLVKLFTFRGTDYTLNWIPFGGFMRPKGENNPTIEGGLAAAKPGVRIAVSAAGPIMNLLLGIVLFSLVFKQIGGPDISTVEIIQVSPNSPAAEAGIQEGDIVRRVNETNINSMDALSAVVLENIGQEVSITLERSGEIFQVSAIPRKEPPPGEGALGIVMSNPIVPLSWAETVPLSMYSAYEYARQLVLLPVNLIQNQISPEESRISGPVGIYNVYQYAREQDIEQAASPDSSMPAVNTLYLLAIISVALGFTNLLPLPALDGGRILLTLPEIVIGRRVPPQFENLVHAIGFTALMTLLIYVTIQDIINPIQLP